jgi:type III secretion system FlhB-like substrate exporter
VTSHGCCARYGSGRRKIIDIAERLGIPVYRDDSISSMLCMLDAGRSIPPELYEIIARIYCSILVTAAKFKGIDDEKDMQLTGGDTGENSL